MEVQDRSHPSTLVGSDRDGGPRAPFRVPIGTQRLEDCISLFASVLGRRLRAQVFRHFEPVEREAIHTEELAALAPVVHGLHHADRLVDLAERVVLTFKGCPEVIDVAEPRFVGCEVSSQEELPTAPVLPVVGLGLRAQVGELRFKVPLPELS